MTINNEQKVFVITDSNSVITSDGLFENNDKVLGFNFSNDSRFDDYNNDERYSALSAVDDEEKLKEDKNGLFATSVTGGKPDRHAKLFFKLLNERGGKIFLHDPATGEITLKEGSSLGSVSSNNKTSQSLAKLINENCGQNEKQGILYRVGINLKNVDFDQYSNGYVDILDLKFISTKDIQPSLQACMIYHFTFERVNTKNYEKKLGSIEIMQGFDTLHDNACINEAKVWNEMNNDSFPRRIETNWSNKYPNFPKVEVLTKIFKSLYFGDYHILIIKSNGSGKLDFVVSKT